MFDRDAIDWPEEHVRDAVLVIDHIHTASLLMRKMPNDQIQAIADRLILMALVIRRSDEEKGQTGNPAFFLEGVSAVMEAWVELEK